MGKVPQLHLAQYTDGNSAERAEFARQMLAALIEHGFFALTCHAIDQQEVKDCLEPLRSFFALPAQVKQRYKVAGSMGQRGYTGFGSEQAIQNNAPDLKEYWHMGREASSSHQAEGFQENVWPEEVPEFRPSLMRLFDSVDAIGKTLLAALEEGLCAPGGYFEKLTEQGNSVLRCLHYPPLSQLKPGPDACYRAAPHKDINLFTLLVGETDSGLQFLGPDGRWLDAEAGPGVIMADSGEMLSRITNDIIPATTHRVAKPKDEMSSRYSIVFLVHPRAAAQLECLESCKGSGAKYPPISAHDFLLNRIEHWRQAGRSA